MTLPLEWTANGVNALSIALAARNSVHTWWTGILGCVLFAVLFYSAQLYADVVLQVFFLVTSVRGWQQWARGPGGAAEPARLAVTRAPARVLVGLVLAALVVAAGYGALLAHTTNAYAPFLDSTVLTLSILGQLLLVQRRYETWWVWCLVNVLSVALFSSRGLWVTAALYTAFLGNALWALRAWRRYLPVTA